MKQTPVNQVAMWYVLSAVLRLTVWSLVATSCVLNIQSF